MHEMSIALDIIEIVRQYVAPDSNQIVKTVNLKVGNFSNIVTETLKFSFDALIKDTFLESAVLNIIEIPLTLKCLECGEITESEPTFFFCGKCDSNNVEIIKGNELQVTDIDVIDK